MPAQPICYRATVVHSHAQAQRQSRSSLGLGASLSVAISVTTYFTVGDCLRQASDRHIMSLLHSRNPVAVRIVRRGQ